MNGNYGCLLRESSRGIDLIDIESRLLAERKLVFASEITTESASELMKALMALQAEDDRAPVTLFISSPGGSVDAGLGLYDLMMSMSCPVTTIASGLVASMASIIYLAGAQRIATPNMKLMIHDPSVSGGSNRSALEFKREAERLLDSRSTLQQIISDRTQMPIEWVCEQTAGGIDCYFTAEEALKYGFAHKMLSGI
jgi:ATP-dependent Clp protease protease subunit